ncbi:MAG: cytochrome D1 domain-containing protein [Chitinophagales bacterium]
MKFPLLSFMLGLCLYSLSTSTLSAQNSIPCPQDYNRLLQLADKESSRGKYSKSLSLLNDAEKCDPSKDKDVDKQRIQLANKWEYQQKKSNQTETKILSSLQTLEEEKEKIIKQKATSEKALFETRKRELTALERLEVEKRQRLIAESQRKEADSLSHWALKQKNLSEKRYLNTQVNLLLQEGDLSKAFRIAEYARKDTRMIEDDFLLRKIYYHHPFQVDSLQFAVPFYRVLDRFDHSIKAIQFSPDNTQILLTFENRSQAAILNQRKHHQVPIKGHTAPIVAAKYSPDGEYIFTASMDSSIKIWNRNAQFLANFKEPVDNLQDLQISENGQYVLTASYGQVKIWDTDGNPLMTIPFPQQQIKKIAWSHQQEYIVVHYNNTVEVWQQKGKRLKYKSIFSKKYPTSFNSLQFSKNDQHLLAAANDGTTRILQISSKGLQEISTINAHQSAVNSAYFSENEHFILTASEDHAAKIWQWNPATAKVSTSSPLALQSQNEGLSTAQFSTDQQQVFTVTNDGSINIWDWQAKPIRMIEGQYSCNAISPNEHLFATTTKERIDLRNFENETQVSFNHQQSNVQHLDFSKDGKFLLSIGKDSTLKVWGWQKQLLMDSLKINSSNLFAEFSPVDNQLIVISSNDGYIRLYNWKTNTFQKGFQAHNAPINSVHFSKDGQYLASAADDKMVIIWDIQTTEKVLMLQGHDSPVCHARFSADGKYLVTASMDKAAKIWQIDDSEVVRLDYRGHTASILDARFLGNNQNRILTTSMDGSAKIWDETGTLLQNLKQSSPIIAAMPSYDLQYWLTFTQKGIFIEYMDGEKLIEKVNEMGVPELSDMDKKWYGLESK